MVVYVWIQTKITASTQNLTPPNPHIPQKDICTHAPTQKHINNSSSIAFYI
jgi:hypothetical protein